MPKANWVQGALFAAPASVAGRGAPEAARRRLSYTRVTRDPQAAISYAESRLVAAQVTQGLADALARLAPERREALRAVFQRRQRWPRSA